MNSRELWKTAAVAVVVTVIVALLAAGLFGLGGGSRTVTVSSPPDGGMPDPPADGSTGVVVGIVQVSGGFELVGITFRKPRYAAQIVMIVPAQCIALDERGAEVVIGTGLCARLPATGPVAGGGVTAEGLILTTVQVPVEEACYRVLQSGGVWPSKLPECAGGVS